MAANKPIFTASDVRRMSTARGHLAQAIARIDAVREATSSRAHSPYDPNYNAAQEQLAKAADAADDAFRRLRLALEVAEV